MINKALIIMAFFNAFIWAQVHQIDRDIAQKAAQVQELNTEITEAQKTIGLTETVDYVEKIGLSAQLQKQITEMQQQKDSYKKQIKVKGSE